MPKSLKVSRQTKENRMKKIYLLASLAFMVNAFAQDANVSLSNLNSNNGYASYDNNTKMVSGLFFEVLSDGNNSNNIISNFQVSIYLLACDNTGSATSSTPIIAKVYQVTGMQQMHALNYSNESVDLSQVSGLADGTYRMGIWVNSDNGVPNPPDNPNDNAGLIQSNAGTDVGSIINFSSAAGIEKIGNNEQVLVYPNPANNSFQISVIGNSKQATICMYDINGKMVLSQVINRKTSIDTSNLKDGVYNISITSSEGVVNRRLVIVR
jgi:hypothetical protein